MTRKFVEEVGIQPSFFTVEAEGKKSEYYYSAEDGIIAKWQYDF